MTHITRRSGWRRVAAIIAATGLIATGFAVLPHSYAETAASAAEAGAVTSRFGVLSDTQIPRALDANGKETAYGNIPQAEINNKNHAKAIDALNPDFITFNGDLTEFGHNSMNIASKYDELGTFKSIYGYPAKAHQPRKYVGLGNHDYENNVNDCYKNQCAQAMISTVTAQRKRAGVEDMDVTVVSTGLHSHVTGSFAYSYVEGGVRHLQLNNHMTYTKSFRAAGPTDYTITPSTEWLKDQLRKSDMPTVIHTHQPRKANDPELDALIESRVGAIFTGHFHEQHGHVPFYDSEWGGVPVFFSGSSITSRFLLGEVSRGEGDDLGRTVLTVKRYSSNGGTARFMDEESVLFPLPTAPHVPPAAQGEVTAGSVSENVVVYEPRVNGINDYAGGVLHVDAPPGMVIESISNDFKVPVKISPDRRTATLRHSDEGGYVGRTTARFRAGVAVASGMHSGRVRMLRGPQLVIDGTIEMTTHRPVFAIVSPESRSTIQPTQAFSGTTGPGAAVTMFIAHGKSYGETKADASGSWTIVPNSPLPSGEQQIAVSFRTDTGEPMGGTSVFVTVKEPSTLGVYGFRVTSDQFDMLVPGAANVLTFQTQPRKGGVGFSAVQGESWTQTIALPEGMTVDRGRLESCQDRSDDAWSVTCAVASNGSSVTFTHTRVGPDAHDQFAEPETVSVGVTVDRAVSRPVEARAVMVSAPSDTSRPDGRALEARIAFSPRPATEVRGRAGQTATAEFRLGQGAYEERAVVVAPPGTTLGAVTIAGSDAVPEYNEDRTVARFASGYNGDTITAEIEVPEHVRGGIHVGSAVNADRADRPGYVLDLILSVSSRY